VESRAGVRIKAENFGREVKKNIRVDRAEVEAAPKKIRPPEEQNPRRGRKEQPGGAGA